MVSIYSSSLWSVSSNGMLGDTERDEEMLDMNLIGEPSRDAVIIIRNYYQ